MQAAETDVPGPLPARAKSEDQESQTWAVLGALRAVMALLVMTGHWVGYAAGPLPFSHDLVPSAYTAVMGFFLVSGFSIAASLERGSRGFYSRRFDRLYPTYLAAFIFAQIPWVLYGNYFFIAPGSGFQAPTHIRDAIWNMAGLPFVIAPAVSTFSISWSLTCEVVFYAVAPWLMRLRAWWPVLGAVSLAAFFWSVGAGISLSGVCYFVSPLCLFWVWLAGFAFYHCRQKPLSLPLLLLVAVPFKESAGVVVLAILTLFYAPQIRLPDRMAAWMMYAGELSYPLYLCHLTVIIFLCQWHIPKILIFVLAPLVAAAFYHGVDLPFRRYRRWQVVRASGTSDTARNRPTQSPSC